MELNSTGLPLLQGKNDSKCQNLLQKFEGYHSYGESFSTNVFFSDKDGLKGREDISEGIREIMVCFTAMWSILNSFFQWW